MYNVPIVSVLKTFLHHSGGQLRHGMDIAGMLCSNANSEYTSCIQSYTNIKKTSSSAYSKSGNSQWQLWIYFIFMVYVRPCPLDHMNCPHCKVHLSVFKTITLKFTESICCVDIVWRSENQNKTNEEHPRWEQWSHFTGTMLILCYKPSWMSFHGNLMDKLRLKVMIDPTFMY